MRVRCSRLGPAQQGIIQEQVSRLHGAIVLVNTAQKLE